MTKNGKTRRDLFISEYLKDQNGKRSAIAAGYAKKTAEQAASRLLRDVKVIEGIAKHQKKVMDKSEVTLERLLGGLIKIAESDIRDAFNADGSMKSIREMPDSLASAISAVDSDELFEWKRNKRDQMGTVKKIKLWDKTRAYELIAKLTGLLIERRELAGKGGRPLIPVTPAAKIDLSHLTMDQLVAMGTNLAPLLKPKSADVLSNGNGHNGT